MLDLQGDWTLITGASSGIGYEMAKILSKEGRNLVLVSRNEERLCEVARELNEIADVIIMPYDLSTPDAANTIYKETARLKLKINILINSAGFGRFGEITLLDTHEVESVLRLNISSLTTLSSLFGLDMKERGRGYILNVASMAAFSPIPYLSAYSASKSYVRNFSLALREELRNYGVKVTCLLPGMTSTKYYQAGLENARGEIVYGWPMMPANVVARTGLEAMFKGKKEVVPGPFNKVVSATFPLIPPAAIARILRKYTPRLN